MPANVVKTAEDEGLWDRAKKQAAKQGHEGDYAYIMGIFQRMKGNKSMTKSFIIPPGFRKVRIGGQVPSREAMAAQKLAETPPKPFNVAMLLDHTEPMLSPESIVRDLGFDQSTRSDWEAYLRDVMQGGNEIIVRKSIMNKCLESKLDPALRRAILQRSLNHWRGKMTKGMVEIVSVDDVLGKAGGHKYVSRKPDGLEKAEARGGTYHRRVARKGGKGFTYYYKPEDYNKRKDAHQSGKDNHKSYLSKKIDGCILKAGKNGCSVRDFKELVGKFGAKKVAGVLEEGSKSGTLVFKKDRFYSKSGKE